MALSSTTEPEYQRPPWPAAVAALIAFGALALSSGAYLPLAVLAIGLLTSYIFPVRFENVTLTKWTLRIIVIGFAVFGYLLTATKDDNAFLDMRYPYSFSLAAASELVLQFWRREPTAGPRAPLTVLLSALVFVAGCTISDDIHHYLWYLAPAYFLFFMLALPRFQPRAAVPLSLTLLPALAALGLGGATHAGFYVYRGALNALGNQSFGSRHTSVSMGMSGQPLLGSSFTLRDSLTRVLRIHHLGADPYLCGMAFDTYTAHTWSPSIEQRTFLPLRLGDQHSGLPGARIHVSRLDDANSLLFVPLHSAVILPNDNRFVEWSKPTGGPLRTAATDTDTLTYDVIPGTGTAPQGLLDAAPTPDETQRDLAVSPEIDPRVLAKAWEIGHGLPRAKDKIAAVIGFLHRNNRYSLTVNPGQGEPISNFILQRKAAHCEYFASAAVILLRALKVPTRYVSGYFAYESDGKDWTLVRQRDAHAWAQSWVQGQGWITVDATPGDGRPDALAGPIPVWWRIWEWMQDALGAIRGWMVGASWTERSTVFGLLVLGLLVPQLYRYWQRRRQAAMGFQYSRPDAALSALAARFESLLTRRGLPCPEGRTWAEHLRLLEEANSGRTLWETFVRDYGQARFGASPGISEITRLDAELRALENSKEENL
ncbi:MAG: transglutaminase-like domain-containing protein [Armatimonadota bacterium]|nr:transglutaminase-like domain-containing protein [Armatimonadota bacterium]